MPAVPVFVLAEQPVVQAVMSILPAPVPIAAVVFPVPRVVGPAQPGMKLVVLPAVAAFYPPVPAIPAVVLPLEPTVSAITDAITTAGVLPITGIPAVPVSPNVAG
jgi:hypothetical protein